MMQRAFDLFWRFSRCLRGNAQPQRAAGRFGLLLATFFGVHGKRPTATFFGVHGKRPTATFFGVHDYIFRGN
jgi:hypothetical protein